MTQDVLNINEVDIPPQEELSLLYRLQRLANKYNTPIPNQTNLNARILELEQIVAYSPSTCLNCSCNNAGCK